MRHTIESERTELPKENLSHSRALSLGMELFTNSPIIDLNIPKDLDTSKPVAGYYYWQELPGGGVKYEIHLSESDECHPLFIQVVAKKLGVSVESMTPQVLSCFMLLHELGHIHQCVEQLGNDVEKIMIKRKQDMQSLPLPNVQPSEVLVELGVPADSPGLAAVQLESQQHLSYRDLNSEDYPDRFAVYVMRENWEELFPNSKISPVWN